MESKGAALEFYPDQSITNIAIISFINTVAGFFYCVNGTYLDKTAEKIQVV